MIFHTQPTDPWDKYDFLFLEAYQILQDETCNSCGHPLWLCRSTENTFSWKVESVVCSADKALKMKEWKRANGKSKRIPRDELQEMGKTYYAVPEIIPGVGVTKLPDRRDYYNQLMNT